MPNYTDPAELLAIVDANDNEIGAERRDIIHRDKLLHRAIHLFIFRTDGRLLLQQRSHKKDQHPLCWECVGGHLGPGETYDACAIREAQQELGLTITTADHICKIPASPATGYEFITVYRAVTHGIPRPNPEEIIALEWQQLSEWQAQIKDNSRLFSPVLIHTIKQILM